MHQEPRFVVDPLKYSQLAIESVTQGAAITLLQTELKEESILREVEEQVIEFVKTHRVR